VQWWGDYGSKTGLQLLSSEGEDFSWRGARVQDADFNGWSCWPGWEEPTRFVRLELSGPSPDCFGLGKSYGLRQLRVLGQPVAGAADASSPVDLLRRWAEIAFASTGTADSEALRFLRGRWPASTPGHRVLVPLRPSRPDSCADINLWLTAGAPSLKVSSGRYYYEVKLGPGFLEPQVGWVTQHFESQDTHSGQGVGDDDHSWGADGQRHLSWHGQEQQESCWPETWRDGDVVGCALDIDAGRMAFSHNGHWVDEASFDLDVFGDQSFCPAASMKGEFMFLVSRSAWCFKPPDLSYRPLMKQGPGGAFKRPR